jgi:hypothetical protein
MPDAAWTGENAEQVELLKKLMSIVPDELTKKAQATLVQNGFLDALAVTTDRLFKTITAPVRLALSSRGLTGLAGVSTRPAVGCPSSSYLLPLCA